MNAQPATIPAQAESSDFFPELLPPRPRRRRTGDIARLPLPVQDSLNRMLDEGVPYAEIIKRLGPDARGLTKQKISRWRYGAHQDYLRKQDLATRTRLLTEFAAELIVQPGSDPDQVARVCREVAAGQMLTTLLDHGKDALGTALKSDPSTVFRLFNTICNVSESCLAAEKARHLFAALSLQPNVEVGRVTPCAPPTGQKVSNSPEQSHPVLDKHFCNERTLHSPTSLP